MSNVEMDILKQEIKHREKIALILVDQLNEKIDECERLKKEVGIQRSIIKKYVGCSEAY